MGCDFEDIASAVTPMVQSLSWPVVVLIIFFSANKRVLDLFGRVKLLKLNDIQFEITEQIQKAKVDTEVLAIERKLSGDKASVQNEYVRDQDILRVRISPTAAILEKWREIENAVNGLFVEKVLDQVPPTSLVMRVELLRQRGVLLTKHIELFTHLFEIRNMAVHSFSNAVVTEGIALEFMGLANSFMALLPEYVNSSSLGVK